MALKGPLSSLVPTTVRFVAEDMINGRALWVKKRHSFISERLFCLMIRQINDFRPVEFRDTQLDRQ